MKMKLCLMAVFVTAMLLMPTAMAQGARNSPLYGKVRIDIAGEAHYDCPSEYSCYKLNISATRDVIDKNAPNYQAFLSVASDIYEGRGTSNMRALTCFNRYFSARNNEWMTYDGYPCDSVYMVPYVRTDKLFVDKDWVWSVFALKIHNKATFGDNQKKNLDMITALWREGCIGVPALYGEGFVDGKNRADDTVEEILSAPSEGVGANDGEIIVLGGTKDKNSPDYMTTEQYLDNNIYSMTGVRTKWRDACPKGSDMQAAKSEWVNLDTIQDVMKLPKFSERTSIHWYLGSEWSWSDPSETLRHSYEQNLSVGSDYDVPLGKIDQPEKIFKNKSFARYAMNLSATINQELFRILVKSDDGERKLMNYDEKASTKGLMSWPTVCDSSRRRCASWDTPLFDADVTWTAGKADTVRDDIELSAIVGARPGPLGESGFTQKLSMNSHSYEGKEDYLPPTEYEVTPTESGGTMIFDVKIKNTETNQIIGSQKTSPMKEGDTYPLADGTKIGVGYISGGTVNYFLRASKIRFHDNNYLVDQYTPDNLLEIDGKPVPNVYVNFHVGEADGGTALTIGGFFEPPTGSWIKQPWMWRDFLVVEKKV